MADSCDFLRTNLAFQTPVYDERFLEDWKPLDAAFAGRHMTEVWKMGTGDTHIADRITIGQPDLQENWQTISSTECDANGPCDPPETLVSYGSLRSQHNMYQKRLKSQLFCLTQLRYNTKPSEQIAMIMKGLKKLPMMYVDDFLQVNAVRFQDTVQICGDTFGTFTPDITAPVTNINGQLTVINLGGAGNLPTSQLTFSYLDYLTATLDQEGYSDAGSGLPAGMFNLMTDKRSWFNLTNGNDSMKDMMALGDPQQASPLYKIGQGVQKPFGNYVPTLVRTPIRFQHMGNGLLNRVQPFTNVAGTTGTQRNVNAAWINARYQLTFIWHPKAIKLFTPDFKRAHEMVPTVNTALFGKWSFINPQGVLYYTMPDGTVCPKNNDEQLWFYWKCALEMGFQYMYPELIMPILHLVDGSGLDSTTDDPVCGDAPQYVAQNYSNSPDVCEA